MLVCYKNASTAQRPEKTAPILRIKVAIEQSQFMAQAIFM